MCFSTDTSDKPDATTHDTVDHPTRVIWIAHHSPFATYIKIFDLTNQLLEACRRDGLAKTVQKRACEIARPLVAKEKTDSLLYAVERPKWNSPMQTLLRGSSARSEGDTPNTGHRMGRMEIGNPGEAVCEFHEWCPGAVAKLKQMNLLGTRHRFIFPQDSPSSSHDLYMQPASFGSTSEFFVKDSVKYTWKVAWHGWAITLHKTLGQDTVPVAYFTKQWGYGLGGVMIVDENQVDLVVATLSALVVIRKNHGSL
jgi:hypothetical protein